ncbi:MAG: putative Ig domain-containing protein, partial [Xanthomonadales bacterium]|nr:putative Ig domain-containing protein [Xanthomonadales bacterium]
MPGNTGQIVTGAAAILALMVATISIVSQGRAPDSSLSRHTPQAAATSAELDEQELLDLLFINSFESNQAPQIVSPARRYASPLHPYEYPVEVFDAEDDPLLFALQAGPVGMQIDLFSGQLAWPSPMLGAHSIEVVVSDIFGGFDTQAWTLTVGENSPPQILSMPPVEAQAGQPWQYLPEVVDPDLELLDHALDTAPVGMTIDPETGRMDWVPEMAGNFAVEWRVQDPSGAMDTQAFTLAVEASDDAPPTITSTPPVQASIDEAWVYSIQAEDPDDNIDLFRVVEGPVGMQIDPATGRVEWTPAEVESVQVTVEVLDTTGLADQQSFTVSVSATPGTTPPEWQGPVALSAPLGRTSTFQLAAFDADGDALRYFVEPLPLPDGMQFSSLTGELTFTPSPDQVGDLALEFAASDGRFQVYRDFTITVPPP